MRRGGGAQSCEARWQDRRVVSHLHIADVAFLLISTKHRRSSAAPAVVLDAAVAETAPGDNFLHLGIPKKFLGIPKNFLRILKKFLRILKNFL